MNKYSGNYILAPGIRNGRTYWIKDDGTQAIWYCNTCVNVRYIIGNFGNLGTKSGALYNFGGSRPHSGDWGYKINGSWNNGSPTIEEISVSSGSCNHSKL